jgi:ribulose-bisphosphate carboxylase large chain
VRKILKIKKRPLCGCIVKPKLGLNEQEHARVAYNAWVGGIDIVKDDENLTSLKFNNFEKRVVETLEARDKAEHKTGERKMYMPNVTAETSEMIKRAEFVKNHGGEYVMVDIITSGWAALQTLRGSGLKLVLHAHRAGHAALTRGRHGISMSVIAEIARLIGVDQLHVGTGEIGKMKQEDDINVLIDSLTRRWCAKPVFPVASGGLHPRVVPSLVKVMGKDLIAQFGGGCHGHPQGTTSGARAIRQAIDAVMKNIDLKEYAKYHKELKVAITKWEK